MVKNKLPAAKDYDIITIGSACVDIFAHSDNQLITIKTSLGEEELLAYPLGSKILIKKIDFQIGGGGTNTAVSFARLGFKTGYMGCLGKDLRGHQVIDVLKKDNVDFIGHFERGKTNLSVILDSIGEDRTILAFKDVSNKLKYKKLDLKGLNPKLVYSSSMSGEGLKTITKVAAWCKKKSIPFAFNPSNYQCERGIALLAKLLKHTSILILNKEEATLLVGQGDDARQLRSLSRYGPKIVVITKGGKGAVCLYKGSVYSGYPSKIKIVETTGAGDAFASGFTTGIVMEDDPVFALKLGFAQAESVCQYHGAKNKLLTKKEALKKVKKDKRRIIRHR